MTFSSSSETDPIVRRRAPAVPVVLAFVIGIVLDASIPTNGWWSWSVAAIALMLAGLLSCFGRFRLSIVLLLIAVAGLGAIRHHGVWFVGAPNNIGLFAREEPQPVWVIGTIADRPQLIRESEAESSRPWGSRERSVLVVESRQLRDGDQWLDVTGGVRVDVSGLASELKIGDEVELIGRLALPDRPRNVGEFNLAEFLRKQGIHAVLRCRSLEAVRLVSRPDDLVTRIRRQLVVAREHCEQLLRD